MVIFYSYVKLPEGTCCKKCLLLMMLSQNKTNVATDEEEWGDGQDEDNEVSQ